MKVILSYDDDNGLLDTFIAKDDAEVRHIFDVWAKWRDLEVDDSDFASFVKDGAFGDDSGFGIDLVEPSSPSKLNKGYAVVSGADVNAAMASQLWVRLFDADEYHSFDGTGCLASYLAAHNIRSVSPCDSAQMAHCAQFGDFTLYWGSQDGESIAEVNDEEIAELNRKLSYEWGETK